VVRQIFSAALQVTDSGKFDEYDVDEDGGEDYAGGKDNRE